MTGKTRQILLISLAEVMDEWLARNAESDQPLEYYGDETAHCMAIAALTVMEATDDLYRTLNKNGMLDK